MYKVTPEDINIFNTIYSNCINSKYGSKCKDRMTYAGDSFINDFEDIIGKIREVLELTKRNNLNYIFPDVTSTSVSHTVSFFVSYVLAKTPKEINVVHVMDKTSKGEKVLYILFFYTDILVSSYGVFKNNSKGYHFIRRLLYRNDPRLSYFVNLIEKQMTKAK